MKMEFINKHKNIILLSLVLYSSLLGLSIAVNNLILIGVTLLPIILILSLQINYKYILSLYVISLPLDFILLLPGIGSISKIFSIFCILSLLSHGLLKKKLTLPRLQIIPVVMLVIIAIFSIVWSVDEQETNTRLITLVPLLLFYIVTSIFKFNIKDLKVINNSMIFSLTWVVFLSLVQFLFGIGFMDTGRLTITLFSEQADPNHLLVSLILPFSILWTSINRSQNYKFLNTKIILIILFFLILLLSGSRGALLAVICSLTYWFLKDGLNFKKFITIIISLGTLLTLFFIIPSFLIERYNIQLILEQGGTGRVDIWRVGLNAFKDSIYNGYGFGTFPQVYDLFVNKTRIDAFWGYSKAAHNTYLRMAVELGLVGISLLIFSMLISLAFIKKKKKKLNSMVLNSGYALNMSLIGIMIGGLSLDIFLFKYFWVVLQYGVIYKGVLAESRKEING
ncbi:hypothetical protein FHE72_21865 [Rossellomorea vietnamensis]|uniref:O-antigen ligase-related domain-containing protein n=2 Tax=Rossellomorea vietnamensis TaxID=218284 RepID=A0A6I6UPL7_9BACI|nr:hypothetical protein FHE72_21865 [Rossellomorea vietnamensis]